MIFVTVGTQLPFDRLTRAIDEWAGLHGRGEEVFAQVGPTEWRPKHMRWSPFITAEEFARRTREARVIVAHAGMGSIITALELGKPILVMPRRASLGEHRNEHQMATASHFQALGRIAVALDEQELLEKLGSVSDLSAADRIAHTASPRLLRALARFAGCGIPSAVADANDARAFEHRDFPAAPALEEEATIGAQGGV
ncbi:MAG: glycosyltransferase [Tepidisphaeraceae bacterium]